MGQRSGKFYYKNEKEVMKKLGLDPTQGSGSGWLQKEDGENEVILAQLKSTDKQSISIKLEDIDKLEYHAAVSHKIPIFMVQFLKNNELFLLVKPMDIPDVAKYLETGEYKVQEAFIPELEQTPEVKAKVIKSGNRENFWKQKEKERENLKCRKRSK